MERQDVPTMIQPIRRPIPTRNQDALERIAPRPVLRSRVAPIGSIRSRKQGTTDNKPKSPRDQTPLVVEGQEISREEIASISISSEPEIRPASPEKLENNIFIEKDDQELIGEELEESNILPLTPLSSRSITPIPMVPPIEIQRQPSPRPIIPTQQTITRQPSPRPIILTQQTITRQPSPRPIITTQQTITRQPSPIAQVEQITRQVSPRVEPSPITRQVSPRIQTSPITRQVSPRMQTSPIVHMDPQIMQQLLTMNATILRLQEQLNEQKSTQSLEPRLVEQRYTIPDLDQDQEIPAPDKQSKVKKEKINTKALPIPDFLRMTQTQRIQMMTTYRKRFDNLRSSFPSLGIREIHVDLQPTPENLKYIHVEYDGYLTHVLVNENMTKDMLFLLLFLGGIEFVLTQFLGLPASGFVMKQAQLYSKYRSLLYEIGEERLLVEGGKKSPTVRLMETILISCLATVAMRLFESYIGKTGANMAETAVYKLMGGTDLRPNDPTEGTGNMDLGGLMNMFQSFMGGGNRSAPAPSQQRGPQYNE